MAFQKGLIVFKLTVSIVLSVFFLSQLRCNSSPSPDTRIYGSWNHVLTWGYCCGCSQTSIEINYNKNGILSIYRHDSLLDFRVFTLKYGTSSWPYEDTTSFVEFVDRKDYNSMYTDCILVTGPYEIHDNDSLFIIEPGGTGGRCSLYLRLKSGR
jgi:hypothetical protein